jgi:hypothetical protein
MENIQQSQDIVVSEGGEHLNFSEHPLARSQVLEYTGHLLQGDPLLISGICNRPNNPECSISNRPIGLGSSRRGALVVVHAGVVGGEESLDQMVGVGGLKRERGYSFSIQMNLHCCSG